MTGKIYLLDASDELRPMDETLYESESLLQELLAKHPDLLAGEQIDRSEPRRWLLISREMAVAAAEDGRADGHWITCSWTKRACRRSSR